MFVVATIDLLGKYEQDKISSNDGEMKEASETTDG